MSATEEYKVQAKLELGAKEVAKGLDAVIGKLRGAQEKIKAIQFGFDGLLSRAIALGAAYFSFQAVARGALNLASSILEANAAAESMQASLATVYAAVEKVSFKQAQEDSASLYRTLQRVAIQSVATTDELMTVFQGVYGPLRKGGLTLQQIVDLTNNASVAASALGVDFQQASRDISAMARGAAGLDVKTFSLLQSMGLITETTEKWNKLTPEKRAKKLMDVMNKIGGQAAEAYGKTWKGLSSTFVDIMSSFKRAFGSAIFERLKGTLAKVNDYLLKNRERIEDYLTTLGERVGAVFDRVVASAGTTFRAIVENIDAVEQRAARLYAQFESLKPTLAAAGKIAIGMQLGAMAFNALVPVVSVLATVLQGVMAVAGAVSAAMAGGAGIAGLFAMLSGALSTAAAAVSLFALPVIVVAAAITALVLGIMEWGNVLGKMLVPLGETIKSIGAQLWTIISAIWAVLKPVLSFIGGVLLVALIAALRAVAYWIDKYVLPKFRILAEILEWVAHNILVPVFNVLEDTVRGMISFFEDVAAVVDSVISAFSDLIQWVQDKIDSVNPFSDSDEWSVQDVADYAALANKIDSMQKIQADAAAQRKAAEKAKRDADRLAREKRDRDVLGKERTSVTNDFRGSKITVTQEFKEADPDNVWIQFRDGLEREAVARTRSGFADPLAR